MYLTHLLTHFRKEKVHVRENFVISSLTLLKWKSKYTPVTKYTLPSAYSSTSRNEITRNSDRILKEKNP